MYKVSYNVAKLLSDLESSKRADGNPRFHISYAAFSETVGLAIKILSDKTRRIDFSTIEALLAFFESEGLPVTISDLFAVTKTGDNGR